MNAKAKMLIDLFVKKIKLFDDKIIIYLTSPLRESPDDENRGFLICRKFITFETVIKMKFIIELYV